MKTLPILATSLLALLVVLGPTAAFAATTLTVSPSQGTYSGSATITLSGTVTPTPTVPSSVVITVKSPSGATVRVSSNPVSTTSGAYSDTWVGGGLMTVSGTYTVNATWGASGSTATAVTSFAYIANGGGGGGGGGVGAYLIVQAVANTPTWPGQKQSLAVLVQWNNGSLACNTPCFTTVHFYTPSGTLITIYNPSNSSTNPITVHRGFFIWSWTVPSSYPDGLYAIHAWASLTTGGVTYQGQGLTSFTINSELASASQQSAILTAVQSIKGSVDTISTAISSTTASDIQSIKTSMSGVSSSLSTLTTTVNGFSSTMNTIQSNLATLLSDISALQTTIGSLNGLSAQITSLQNAISSNQTYVLVVAALAAITLVLELAILVRKLS